MTRSSQLRGNHAERLLLRITIDSRPGNKVTRVLLVQLTGAEAAIPLQPPAIQAVITLMIRTD